jgi:N-succinyldiaminopimelate aminotransferase
MTSRATSHDGNNDFVNKPDLPHPAAARRLQGFTSTIFAEMSALAASTGSINLGQGFPDESGPVAVLDRAIEAMRAGRNQYPAGHGDRHLIEAVRAHQERHYGLQLDQDEVVITTGATEAIAAAVLALVDPGDEVVLIEPFYDSYPAMVQFAGGVRRTVTLAAPDFRIEADALEAAITPRTRVLICNTPHNPTGRVFTRSEMSVIADVAQRHDLIVISDEVYEHLAFEGHQHLPIATLPGMYERTITISSAGKTFSLTGWKIGWASGPAGLIKSVEAAKNWLSYSSGAPFQPAIAHALNHEEDFHQQLRLDLQRKQQLLAEGLNAVGLLTFPSEGTYFTSTDVRPLGFTSALHFCQTLAAECGVVAIPSDSFYEPGEGEAENPYVRWACCKKDAVLHEGLNRLSRLSP